MNTPERERFEAWYAENAFDYVDNPVGSRECGLQWKSWQAALATRNEESVCHPANCRDELLWRKVEDEYKAKVKELEAELRTAKQEALTFELAWNNEGGKIEQLQAQVAMKDEALESIVDSGLLIGSYVIHDSMNDIARQALTASPNHWLEKKLLEARIDELDAESDWERIDYLRNELAALEGEKNG